ncbi:MAG: hypothetical protein IKN47_06480 [Lachnospiraceae bacterium]|nr:hypothetical protein [Lachnospiraceae bacterium]
MKFKIVNNPKDDKRDIKQINHTLTELIEVLEVVLSSIDKENISPGVLETAGARPVGSLEFRYMMSDNAGYDYGTWQLVDDTITTHKGFVYIYMRTK